MARHEVSLTSFGFTPAYGQTSDLKRKGADSSPMFQMSTDMGHAAFSYGAY